MRIRRDAHALSLATVVMLGGPALRPAVGQLLGPEFPVNSFTTSNQVGPAVAADGAGNFVVVWDGYLQDGSNYGQFGQRFNPAGSRVGSEFQVNTFTTARQKSSAVAADGAGNFVVVWESNGQDGSSYGVFGQRYDSAGSRAGSEIQVNTYTTNAQRFPAVAADSAGNFVVAWQSLLEDGSNSGVFGQRFNAAGGRVGNEFRVNTYTANEQRYPAVAAADSGSFVVVWESYGQDASVGGVFAQRYDAAGNPIGTEFRVNTYTPNDQRYPAVAEDGAGRFVVVWQSYLQDGSNFGLFGRRYDSLGTALGSEFQVNTYTTSLQTRPAVAADGWGNFVVAWQSNGQDGSSWGAFSQRFNSAGSRVESEFRVNSATASYQTFPAVAADGSGNFVVAWQSYAQDGAGWGVFGRQLTIALFADGFELGDACAWSATVGGGC